MSTADRASGCLFGLALGDALGAPTEFIKSVEEIVRRFPPDGPQEPRGNPACVTDDTQMMLAVGEALMEASGASGASSSIRRPLTPQSVEPAMRRAFIRWNRSPENNRAPGITCMNACANLETGQRWQQATIARSKGCGANMRVAPVGLLRPERDGVTPETRAAIAQFQGALTHGHPTALAASDLTATAIAYLASGASPTDLVQRLQRYAEQQREVYHHAWLGDLWQQSGASSPEAFIAHGWDECLETLERLDAALSYMDRESDPCLATGEGWVAEEAFATGLLCFLLFRDDPVAALRRAAVTSGDSDSIACLCGAFAGAHYGLAAWPEDWLARIEYRERLTALATYLE